MRRGAALLIAALWQSGCHALAPSAASTTALSAPAQSVPARVELRRVADRPSINLVARLGDPSPAIALAVAHDLGAEASTALAALITARMQRFGVTEASGAPHQIGLSVSALVATPEAASRFITAADSALRSPVNAGEPSLLAVRDALRRLAARAVAGHASAAVDACSGELGVAPGYKPFDPTTAAGAAQLEAWRQRVANAASVAFGALGPTSFLDATTASLARGAAWPSGPPPDDAWPPADVVGVDGATDSERRLSVAFRIPEAGVAIEAARRLGAARGALAARLGAFDPGWQVERVVGTTRPRGACLRIDARAPDADPPAARRVARVLAVIEQEAKLSLGRAAESAWTLEDSVLRPADPRQAAAVAAWRALGGRLQPGPVRELASYETHASEAGATADRALTQALAEVRATWAQPVVERRTRVEAGQGELWALLASPCGTSSESSADAGLTALVVRALAGAGAGDDVAIEPWITADGIGLLAHAPRRGPDETPEQHARRVGSALGRALVATRLHGADVADAREALLAGLGPGPRPGYWLALESLAPDHPSWLEPRGTWQSITEAARQDVATRRRRLLSEPLRVAVLASWDAAQAETTAQALERWLRPVRREPEACPSVSAPAPKHGELDLETSAAPDHGASAYVAVPLPAGTERAARWTTLLLDRDGGWLDQALRKPGLASSAHATLLGGSHARALVIEITANPDAAHDAVAQVRGLLDHLARGAATAGDLRYAAERAARIDTAAELDPRRRIVDLWRGSADAAAPDLAALRRFHQQAFRADAPVVVYVKRRR